MGTQRAVAALVGALSLAACPAPAAAQQTVKFATLAPEGSSWMKLLREWGQAVHKRTHGRVKLKFQPGGVAGDERDMVRLMNQGRAQGAAMTGIGLGLVMPELRILELPFLIRTDAELDQVQRSLAAQVRRKLEQRGYVMLVWGDAGWVHIFGVRPITSRADVRKLKFWTWTDDPIARALATALGANTVPLGAPDVLPGLTTGQIESVYGTPLTILALQWHRKLKYMLEGPITCLTLGVIMTRRDFERLLPEDQRALTEEAAVLEARLRRQVRAESAQSLVQLKKAGIHVLPAAPGEIDALAAECRKAWLQLAGTVFAREDLDGVQRLLGELRRAKK